MREPTFLTLAEIIEIHADQIMRYGGREGIRDIALLSSAAALPYATFSGQFLHGDIFQMAAAYAFHISQNHPFVDGNKRTALAAALVFLELNRCEISDPKGMLYDAMINLATGKLNNNDLAGVLRKLGE